MSRSLSIGWAAASDTGSPALLIVTSVAAVAFALTCIVLARRVTRLRSHHGQLLRRVLDAELSVDPTARRDTDATRTALRMEGVARLAGRAAHDLRNVLTALTSQLQGLAAPEADAAARTRHLQRLERVVSRLEGLTRELAVLGRKGDGARLVVSLGQVVRDALAELRDQLPDRIAVVTDLPEAWVLGDEARLREVVVQLVRNAVQATADTERIEIQVVAEGAGDATPAGGTLAVRLHVRDGGSGLSPDLAARAFDPLVTNRGPGATGLGLATVKSVVEEHGGEVDLIRRPGRGTEVVIRLPGSGARPAAETDGHGGELVLVAEPSDQIRRIVASALVSEGYEVVQAGTVEEALAGPAAEGAIPALCVVDADLPGASTATLLSALADRHDDVPIILLQGHTGGQAPDGARERGTDRAERPSGKTDAAAPKGDRIVLHKPFQVAALCALVRETLDRWPAGKVPP